MGELTKMNCDGDDPGGGDTEGHSYNSIMEMWNSELASDEGRKNWYATATCHWETQDANINGILGGYPEANGPDLRESKRFLRLLKTIKSPPDYGTALDCGAGIGRVTDGLLLHFFKKVDLVEPSERLLGVAQKQISNPRVGQFI